MWYVSLNAKTTEFELKNRYTNERMVFAGTVDGALAMLKTIVNSDDTTNYHSSDLNHPDDYPKFEPHSIDVAAGYLDGAIEAGIIKIG